MLKVEPGQCGLCAHFGENKSDEPQLIQIRMKHEAPEDYVVPCGHPTHAPLKLEVTPISSCAGYTPVEEVAASAS